jgi:hypothetical protein
MPRQHLMHCSVSCPTPQSLSVEGFLAKFDRRSRDYEKVTHSCEYCPSPHLVHSSCLQQRVIPCASSPATMGT